MASVPSTYSGETDTQSQRLEHEARDAEQAAKTRFHDVEQSARRDYAKGKSAAGAKGKEAKAAVKGAGRDLSDNRDNPVVIGNAVVWAVVAATLG